MRGNAASISRAPGVSGTRRGGATHRSERPYVRTQLASTQVRAHQADPPLGPARPSPCADPGAARATESALRPTPPSSRSWHPDMRQWSARSPRIPGLVPTPFRSHPPVHASGGCGSPASPCPGSRAPYRHYTQWEYAMSAGPQDAVRAAYRCLARPTGRLLQADPRRRALGVAETVAGNVPCAARRALRFGGMAARGGGRRRPGVARDAPAFRLERMVRGRPYGLGHGLLALVRDSSGRPRT